MRLWLRRLLFGPLCPKCDTSLVTVRLGGDWCENCREWH